MGQPETTFGATIISQHDPPHDTQRTLPSLTPAVSNVSFAPSYSGQPIPPCSPFYQHPPASHERVPPPQPTGKSHLDIDMAEKGLIHDELSPISASDKNPFCSTISVNTNKECTMWPSRQTLATTKLAEKKKKRSDTFCACAGLRHNWEQLHKNHKLTVRIVLALILIGAMIGLGVGISKAVHGSYYSGTGNSMTT